MSFLILVICSCFLLFAAIFLQLRCALLKIFLRCATDNPKRIFAAIRARHSGISEHYQYICNMKNKFYIVHFILILIAIGGIFYLSFHTIGNQRQTHKLINEHPTAFFIIRFLINCIAYLNMLIATFFVNNYFAERGVEKLFLKRMRLLNLICFILSSIAFIGANMWQQTVTQ
jgi:hypothetical protein